MIGGRLPAICMFLQQGPVVVGLRRELIMSSCHCCSSSSSRRIYTTGTSWICGGRKQASNKELKLNASQRRLLRQK